DLNIVTDFRWGGQIFSPAILYGTGAGLYTNSLYGRDAALGGLPYYVDANGTYVGVGANTSSGPQGQPIYHDGVILKGVTSDGKPNTTMIDAPSYYLNSFTWGEYPGSGADGTYASDVFNNNDIKLREISRSYTFQLKMRSKFKLQNLMLTLYGSNLFYFYKSLPYLDPEEGIGTNYLSLATEGGEMAASRSYGASVQVSF
ncbi:MAG: SusC/RagA family TonB-linked outer membrane protein, partial [Chitinophagaceae bacterium]